MTLKDTLTSKTEGDNMQSGIEHTEVCHPFSSHIRCLKGVSSRVNHSSQEFRPYCPSNTLGQKVEN